MIDPLTITCDMIVNGERVKWIGAKALARHVNAEREAEQARREAVKEAIRQRMMRGGR